jgi:hypothetical protein
MSEDGVGKVCGEAGKDVFVSRFGHVAEGVEDKAGRMVGGIGQEGAGNRLGRQDRDEAQFTVVTFAGFCGEAEMQAIGIGNVYRPIDGLFAKGREGYCLKREGVDGKGSGTGKGGIGAAKDTGGESGTVSLPEETGKRREYHKGAGGGEFFRQKGMAKGGSMGKGLEHPGGVQFGEGDGDGE